MFLGKDPMFSQVNYLYPGHGGGHLTGGNPNYLEFTQERLGYHT